MTSVHTELSDRLGRIAGQLAEPSCTDKQLIERFITTRDEESFSGLVRRHGPLVLAICRRVAADHHLADDAFQAVFLVLARKADTINPREAIRSWLYGVATNIALRARTMTDRRRKKETLTSEVPEKLHTPTAVTNTETLQILDEEIAALPEHLRVAIVLCEFDGVTRREAASRLGVPEGTLSSRLAKGRKILARRLRERGVVAPLVGLSSLFGLSVEASVSVNRVASTAQVAVGSLSPSATAAKLYCEVLRNMLLNKLKYVPVVILGLAIAATSLGLDSDASPDRAPLPRSSPAQAIVPFAIPLYTAQVPKPEPRKTTLMLWAEGYPILINPEGTVIDRPNPEDWFPPGKFGPMLTLGQMSPDGKRIVFCEVMDGSKTAYQIECLHSIRTLTAGDKPIEVVKGVRGISSFWSRDGNRIFGSGYDPEKADKLDPMYVGTYEMENWVVDLKTGKKSAVAVPSKCAIRDESPNGRIFLTTEFWNEKTPDGKWQYCVRSFITTPGTNPEHKPIAPELGNLGGLAFSPDGRKVLAFRYLPESPQEISELLTIDLKTGTVVQLGKNPIEKGVFAACWSPDGTKVAYVWLETAPAPPGGVPRAPGDNRPIPVQPPGMPATIFIGSNVVIVDADGKNSKKIHTESGVRIQAISWR